MKVCTCTQAKLRRYDRRFSGPLLDRIDIYVHVRRPEAEMVMDGAREVGNDERVGDVRGRILEARARQAERSGEDIKL